MPRGSIVTEIPVPTQGARSDVPRHRLPPDAMVADDAANILQTATSGIAVGPDNYHSGVINEHGVAITTAFNNA